MRIIKCDFCGAEIETGGPDNVVPSDNGWVVIEGRKMAARYEQDCCPRCRPQKITTNRERFKGLNKCSTSKQRRESELGE